MRKKEEYIVISFSTYDEAIAFEDICRENRIAGRMIPKPEQVSAGCGLCWLMTEDREKEGCLKKLAQAGVTDVECIAVELWKVQ